MSFYSGNRQGVCPGPISGNPTNGLCERVCIQTKKVFDACVRQETDNNIQLKIDRYDPVTPENPLTFVSGKIRSDKLELKDLVVDRFEDKPCFARVTGTLEFPVEVSFTDVNGVPGVGYGTISVKEDVVLYVPQPSIVPYDIEAFVSGVVTNGTYISDKLFSIDMCLNIMLKVVVNAEILVPSYGYCPIPPCQEYTKDVCSGFFNLPLYPQINN